MDGREFLDVTRALCASKKTAAPFMRTAISRAYYAAHHYGRRILLLANCPNTASRGRHGDVWRALGQARHTPTKQAAGMLSDLYEKRRLADYEMSERSSERPANAEEALKIAEEILNNLSHCEHEKSVRNRLRADLRQAGIS